MRLRVWLVLLLTFPGYAPASPPQRVMSLNLCSDQLVLELLPPSRITSVSYFSREPYQSYLSAEARRVGVNYGNAEEVITQRPDLVIAGVYTTPATRQLLKEVGIPLLELPPANSFQDIRDTARRVARAVGADEKAEELISQMDVTLAELATTAPRQPLRIVGWDGGNTVEGKGTLFDAIVSAAGAVNIGASPGLQSRAFGVEELLFSHADLLAFGDATVASPSLQAAPLTHPAVEKLYRGRSLVYPELLYSCGLPRSAQAAQQMRQMMLRILRSVPAT